MAYSNGYADPGIDYGTGDNPPVIHNMPDLDPDHYAPPLSTPYAAQADCFPPQAPNQVSQVPEQYHQPPAQLQHHANYPPMQPNYPPMQNGAVPIHGVAPAQQPMVLSPSADARSKLRLAYTSASAYSCCSFQSFHGECRRNVLPLEER